MITIRHERPEDTAAVRRVNLAAFEQPAEADIVDALRTSCDDVISLVAIDGDVVVGHILFSPVTIDGDVVAGMGLAPMAVLPEYQRQGVGTAMVDAGLAMLRERFCPFVVVLGHPGYYPRFGFEPASRHGLRSQWGGVPDEAFLVIVNDPDAMQGIDGVARYRDEFDAAM